MRIQKGAGGFCSKAQAEEPEIRLDYSYRSLTNRQLTNLLSKYTPSQRCKIVSLNVSGNRLTLLPPLPDGLIRLNCKSNDLTILPELPVGLKNLNCNGNELTVLPTLPTSLKYLECMYNKLTVLPPLPNGLLELVCMFNKLTVLPTLPASLASLECERNNLRVLPELPDRLRSLKCSRNPFDEPFKSYLDIYWQGDNLELLKTSVNNYYNYYERRSLRTLGDITRINAKRNNLRTHPGFGSIGPLATATIGSFVSGVEGRLNEQHEALRLVNPTKTSTRRQNRKSRKSKSRKSRR